MSIFLVSLGLEGQRRKTLKFITVIYVKSVEKGIPLNPRLLTSVDSDLAFLALKDFP